MNASRWTVVLAVLCVQAFAQTTVEEMRRHRPDFRYLEPGQLRELPQVVRADLEKLGCRVPRFLKWDARHNVIQGQFFKPGQSDWAVLCEAAGKTGIMLYPGGAATDLPMLRGEPTNPARTIHVVSAFVLNKRATRDHPEGPVAPFDHDGIEDGPIEASGRVIYHRDDDWEEL
ncbi:MAG TPA: hypothetical protein VF523_13310 [Burkholderiales bacterium]